MTLQQYRFLYILISEKWTAVYLFRRSPLGQRHKENRLPALEQAVTDRQIGIYLSESLKPIDFPAFFAGLLP